MTGHFYDMLDKEINAIIARYKTDGNIIKHKDINQKKAYGFLIWFLEFYGQLPQYKNYITDGHGDASCDIIFDKTHSQGRTVFYIIQSKWCSKKNALVGIKAHDVKYSLNDFETIIRGDRKKTENEKFNQSYEALLEHLRKNGIAKFIFFALARGNEEYADNIVSFNKNNAPNISVEVIDIERIKWDYIELKYKKIKRDNPLEPRYDPEYSKINLQIERFADVPGKGDIIKKTDIYTSYIVMVKPKVIYELFEKFGFALFYKNVRNPLHESNYNSQIARTLRERPALFWYFNNGITAISKIIPEIGNEAQEIEITGLQIINGAQTVYSVYTVYNEASSVEREIMDKDALIALRLVDSNDAQFNLEITRYNNSQNPMENRDFQANEDIQLQIQKESFETGYWYEKRRGEFRKVPGEIKVIGNTFFAAAYLSFYMEDVYNAVFKNHMLFVSKEVEPDGLYEKIFNSRPKFNDMLASFLVVENVLEAIGVYKREDHHKMGEILRLYDERFLLALVISFVFKIILKNYLKLKFNQPGNTINVTKFILDNVDSRGEVDNLLQFSIGFIGDSFNLFDSKGKVIIRALKEKELFQRIIGNTIKNFREVEQLGRQWSNSRKNGLNSKL